MRENVGGFVKMDNFSCSWIHQEDQIKIVLFTGTFTECNLKGSLLFNEGVSLVDSLSDSISSKHFKDGMSTLSDGVILKRLAEIGKPCMTYQSIPYVKVGIQAVIECCMELMAHKQN